MKAIALVSGGLDSTLALRLVKEQGVEITLLNFKTPFCQCDRKNPAGCASISYSIACELGLEFKVANLGEAFLEVIKKPKHGYGSNMNPCIDCRILMLRKAKEYMLKWGAEFVVTGEVLGQRPMSQHKKSLALIEKEAGLEGLVLRPLSARLLPETIPEKRGWVLRDKFLDFNGRSRRPQMQLAQSFKIKDYPCSAGGCLLTDPEFSKRIRDALKYGQLDTNNVELLKAGRHFRLSDNAKLIVGRNEQENERILNLVKENDLIFMPKDIAGPTALGRGVFGKELMDIALGITCHYCDLNGSPDAELLYRTHPQVENKVVRTPRIPENQLISLRI